MAHGRPRGGATSRRLFLRTTGLFVAGGTLAACGSSGSDTKTTTTTDQTTTLGGSAVQGDIALLNSTLDLELEAVAAYAAAREALSGRMRSDTERFAEQEREHADEIARAVEALGGKPNEAQDDYGFPALDSPAAALEFTVGIENTAIAWYIDALPKFSSPELRGTAASIATVEAEQLAVLLGLQDRPQVPEAFVLGRKS